MTGVFGRECGNHSDVFLVRTNNKLEPLPTHRPQVHVKEAFSIEKAKKKRDLIHTKFILYMALFFSKNCWL